MPLAIGFLAAVAALAPPLPPPPTSPTQVWGFGCSFIGLTGFILTCFVTLSPTWKVWGMSQCLSQDELLAPLLSTDPLLQVSSYSRVRTIYWLLALFLHSVNATLYLQKRLLLLENNFDCNGFFSECILPIVALIACTVYLVHLCWTSFPGKEVIFAGCTACIFYFSIAFTSLVYSNTTIAFEIVHILITIVVNILRFSSQDKIPECGWFCLTVAVAGTIIGFQWLPLRWCISVGDTKPKLHIAYKIAASVGGAFSFCDIVVISCPRARKNANKLLNILHECFY